MTNQPVDDRETTDQHTQADDLVERLIRKHEAETWYDGGYRHMVLVNPDGPEAAAYIKELKAEVERWKEAHYNMSIRAGNEIVRVQAAEARATKAEDALRVIATNKTRLGITWAQEYAREDPGEGKA